MCPRIARQLPVVLGRGTVVVLEYFILLSFSISLSRYAGLPEIVSAFIVPSYMLIRYDVPLLHPIARYRPRKNPLRPSIFLGLTMFMLLLFLLLMSPSIFTPLSRWPRALGSDGGSFAWAEIATYLFRTVLVAPVLEEVAYRGVLLNVCSSMEALPLTSAFVSSTLFALSHLLNLTSGSHSFVFVILQCLVAFVNGFAWSTSTLYSGRLWPAVVLHGANNVFSTFVSPVVWSLENTAFLGMFLVYVIQLSLISTLYLRALNRVALAAT
mmetsp:Transcript_4267/g.11922  ORF Transcript_4267/g.11922 Transcript_4267/m.11922 type:complete len:268 (+) Transcript_4267:105-908(+)